MYKYIEKKQWGWESGGRSVGQRSGGTCWSVGRSAVGCWPVAVRRSVSLGGQQLHPGSLLACPHSFRQ